MKIKLEEVFVDMDGVLTDFVGATLKKFNKKNPWEEKPSLRGSYDLAACLGVSASEMWKTLDDDPTFWENLEPTAECFPLMNELEDRFEQRVHILTAPSLNPWCHYGKAAWIREHFPRLATRSIFANAKHLLASSNRVLIDDSDSNINKFKKYHGRGILVPRLWNSNYAGSYNNACFSNILMQLKMYY